MLLPARSGTTVKITDFGLAKNVSAESTAHTSKGEVLGTPDYMAPEQLWGDCSKQTDIYALGLTIFCMLAGKLPVSRSDPFGDATKSRQSQVPTRWKRVINRCLATNPSDRFSDVEEVWDALSGEVSASSLRRKSKPSRIKLAAFAMLLITLVAVGIVLIRANLVTDSFRAVPTQKHIAVLPFRNIGGGASSQAFADGIVDGLTTSFHNSSVITSPCGLSHPAIALTTLRVWTMPIRILA